MRSNRIPPQEKFIKKNVMELMQNHFNEAHSLYLDNFHTSVDIAETLQGHGTYCRGTLFGRGQGNPVKVTKT